MAGSRPVSFLPDSSSALDKHRSGGGFASLSRFTTFTRLFTNGYLVTRFAPAPLPTSRPRVPDEAPARGAPKRAPKETLGGISTSCYVELVRGESDELTLDSLRAKERRQNRYFTASRNDLPSPLPPHTPDDATLYTRNVERKTYGRIHFFLYPR